jgi:hypothetical protein
MGKVIDFSQYKEMDLINRKRDLEYHRYMEFLFGYDWIGEGENEND